MDNGWEIDPSENTKKHEAVTAYAMLAVCAVVIILGLLLSGCDTKAANTLHAYKIEQIDEMPKVVHYAKCVPVTAEQYIHVYCYDFDFPDTRLSYRDIPTYKPAAIYVSTQFTEVEVKSEK